MEVKKKATHDVITLHPCYYVTYVTAPHPALQSAFFPVLLQTAKPGCGGGRSPPGFKVVYTVPSQASHLGGHHQPAFKFFC